ncbi:MAG TPA: KTSC domain-containing protein [Steroidobacter sp.]|nr:KTSC domain-containing protein [Steroidobacter sp.]
MPSTVIESFDYDASKRELLVVFRSGRRYVYEDVPESTHAGLRGSFSKGEYFNEHIRDRYVFRRADF